MTDVDRLAVIAQRITRRVCEKCGSAIGEVHADECPVDRHAPIVEVEYVRADLHRGGVLTPEQAAVAATLVDMMKRDLPPHISEEQQVDTYLALKRVGGQ
jgi:hypothetical protein